VKLAQTEEACGEMGSMGEWGITERGGRTKMVPFSIMITKLTIALSLCHWAKSACYLTSEREATFPSELDAFNPRANPKPETLNPVL
jgi:hypothetical protein